MIFILGFRTPNSDEIPAILYLGNDGDAALQAAESALHPRVAKMVNPQLYPIRHWSEGAAASFEKLELLADPKPTEGPSIEGELAMLDRIEKLEALLAAERSGRIDDNAKLAEEFDAQIKTLTEENASLQARLAAAPQTVTPLPVASEPHETPAPDTTPVESGAESAGGPAAAGAGATLAEADEPPSTRKGKGK